MITTIFSKTRPFNYFLVALLHVLCFVLYCFSQNLYHTLASSLIALAIFLLSGLSILLINFVGLKYNLTKNNTYAMLFSFLFFLMFPQLFNDFSLVFANILVLLAIRRLVAIQSLKDIKQKIFDASILIFVATLLEFWAILFLFLVFVIIVFYAARDYRNWIVPIIALAATLVLFFLYMFRFDPLALVDFTNKINVNTALTYFSNIFQNIAFSVYASLSMLFLIHAILTNNKKPLAYQALFRFIILNYFIAVVFFIVSPAKDNSFLIFTFAPLAIMATNFFENIDTNWVAEVSAALITVLAVVCFIGQL